jgi:hypothetical protein
MPGGGLVVSSKIFDIGDTNKFFAKVNIREMASGVPGGRDSM